MTTDEQEQQPWRWRTLVENLAPMADRVLILGADGGEPRDALAEIADLADVLPAGTVVIAGRASDVPGARERLAPLGIEVLAPAPEEVGTRLPVGDESYDLVLCRHAPVDATDVARVLAPGGTLLTEQAGQDDGQEIRALLDDGSEDDPESGSEDGSPCPGASLEDTVHAVTVAGLTVERADAFHDRLRTGPLTVTVSRYLVQASLPAPARTGRTDFSQLLEQQIDVPRV